jgi:hypothetical protein
MNRNFKLVFLNYIALFVDFTGLIIYILFIS